MSEVSEEIFEEVETEQQESEITIYYVMLEYENDRGYFSGNWSAVGLLPNAVEVDSLPPTDDMLKEKCHYLENGSWVFDEEKYNVLLSERELKKEQLVTKKNIAAVAEALDKSDYKSIKCSEVVIKFLLQKYPELAELLPYDFEELFEKKQSMRAEINELEEQL